MLARRSTTSGVRSSGWQTPVEAVDRLVRLYDEATQALHGAVERFLKDGEPPSAATRALFRYPELRLTYAPNGPAPSNARAFAKFSEAGVYTTTVTQPADFRAYLLEQLEPLVTEYGATIEVGVGAQEIPYPYVIESGDELTAAAAPTPPSSRGSFPCPRWRRSATRPPTASSTSAPSGRSPCSTRRASITRCAASCTTPAPTGGRCSPGCCSPTTTAMSTSSCNGA